MPAEKDGLPVILNGRILAWNPGSVLLNEDGRMYAIATTERGSGIETDGVLEARNDRQG